MNMGIGDVYDLGWKLVGAMRYGGRGLLKSYTADRRPVVLRNVKHSGVHMRVHSAVAQFFEGGDPHRVDCPQRRAKRYEWPGSEGVMCSCRTVQPSSIILAWIGRLPPSHSQVRTELRYCSTPQLRFRFQSSTSISGMTTRDVVLVHPDEHVAWRGNSVDSAEGAQRVMRLVMGLEGTKADVLFEPLSESSRWGCFDC